MALRQLVLHNARARIAPRGTISQQRKPFRTFLLHAGSLPGRVPIGRGPRAELPAGR